MVATIAQSYYLLHKICYMSDTIANASHIFTIHGVRYVFKLHVTLLTITVWMYLFMKVRSLHVHVRENNNQITFIPLCLARSICYRLMFLETYRCTYRHTDIPLSMHHSQRDFIYSCITGCSVHYIIFFSYLGSSILIRHSIYPSKS